MFGMVRSPSAPAGLLLALAPLTAGAQQSIDELSPEDARSLRESIAGSLYRVEPAGDGLFVAPNPAQEMRSAFGPCGIEVRGPGWSVSLALEAWGREGAMLAAEDAELRVDGRRVEYRRGALTEWYVNEARGLEQGFTIGVAPVGEGALAFALSLDGGEVDVLPGGRDARLTVGETGAVLHYAGLRAFDATGRELAASMSVQGTRLSIDVEDEGAVYPLVVDPWIATELAKLTASDAASQDFFGSSVAVSGDTALVGAESDDHVGSDAGSAYVFERDQGGPGAWGEVVKLIASDTAPGDSFGSSVAISGDTAVVGADGDSHAGGSNAGSAYVFERDQGGPGAWGEVAKLTASDAAFFDSFGYSVAVSGDTAAVGAYLDDHAGGTDAGSAYVFERDQGGPGAWGEVKKLTASDAAASDQFGISVATSGDTAVVGAWRDDHKGATDAGSAYVFERDQGGPGAWGEVAKLTASDAAVNDYFGSSVAVSGDTALVGAYWDDHAGGDNAGSAYVFERDQGGPGAWGDVVKLTAGDAAAFDRFGISVAVSGDTALVGAENDDHDGGSNAGSAYVFDRNQGELGVWGEVVKLTASDPAGQEWFGHAVAISGDTALVGALGDDHAGATDAGSAYVYGISFTSETYCAAGTSASGCQASISAAGTASATAASGFVLMASSVEGSKDGLFFFGTNGKQANPWGNGTSYQCVVPPVMRAGLLAGVGTAGACDGSFAQDLNAHWCPTCPKPSHNPGAGTLAQAQLWYRDPQSTSNQSTSLSDAIEFLVGP